MNAAPALVLYAPTLPGDLPSLLLARTSPTAAEKIAREESEPGGVIDVYAVTVYPGVNDLPDWRLVSRWIGGNLVQHTQKHTPQRY